MLVGLLYSKFSLPQERETARERAKKRLPIVRSESREKGGEKKRLLRSYPYSADTLRGVLLRLIWPVSQLSKSS